MRTVKRIVNLHRVDGFNVYALFNNGEFRVIDFAKLFDKWNVEKGDLEYPLMTSQDAFQKVELENGTLVWKNITFSSTDQNGESVTRYFDLDPIVLYEASEKDADKGVDIGLMIKQKRKELGLTQEELATKSGTSKHYISRIENNKTNLELSTLTRIVEGGLGRKMRIEII